jgi:ABC-type transporter Mla subunit MlaD
LSGKREVTTGGTPAAAQDAAKSSERKRDIRPELRRIDRLVGGEVGQAISRTYETIDHNVGVDMATIRAKANAASDSADEAKNSAGEAATSLRNVETASQAIADNVGNVTAASQTAATKADEAAQSASDAQAAAESVKDALTAEVSGETSDGQPATITKRGADLVRYNVRISEENRRNVGNLLDNVAEVLKELGIGKQKDGEASEDGATEKKTLREQVEELKQTVADQGRQLTGALEAIELFTQILQVTGLIPKPEKTNTQTKEGED